MTIMRRRGGAGMKGEMTFSSLRARGKAPAGPEAAAGPGHSDVAGGTVISAGERAVSSRADHRFRAGDATPAATRHQRQNGGDARRTVSRAATDSRK